MACSVVSSTCVSCNENGSEKYRGETKNNTPQTLQQKGKQYVRTYEIYVRKQKKQKKGGKNRLAVWVYFNRDNKADFCHERDTKCY